MKGCLTAIAIVILVVAGIVFFVLKATGPVVEEADRFFGLLGAGKVQEAYDSTAADFRKETDLPKFKAFVSQFGLDGFQTSSWSSRNISNNTGRVEGKLTMRDGRTLNATVTMLKDGDRWRVVTVNLFGDKAKGPEGKSAEQPSPAAVPSGVAVSSPAGAQASASPSRTEAFNKVYTAKGEVPDTEQLDGMIDDTLMSFNDAVQASDFSRFHRTLAAPFQKKYSADELAGVFRTFIEKGVDLSRLRGKQPKLTKAPKLEENDLGPMLAVEGEYPGENVSFELEYLEENGRWALAGINVRVK